MVVPHLVVSILQGTGGDSTLHATVLPCSPAKSVVAILTIPECQLGLAAERVRSASSSPQSGGAALASVLLPTNPSGLVK